MERAVTEKNRENFEKEDVKNVTQVLERLDDGEKPTLGFEPRTYALRKHCSTTELSWRESGFIGRASIEVRLARLKVRAIPNGTV